MYTALTKCFYCGEDNEILLHTQLKDISQYHGKIINQDPCQKCEKMMETHVCLIVVEKEENNPIRTGELIWVKKECVNIDTHVGYITSEDAKKLGFID